MAVAQGVPATLLPVLHASCCLVLAQALLDVLCSAVCERTGQPTGSQDLLLSHTLRCLSKVSTRCASC